jgi:hypothetical protein
MLNTFSFCFDFPRPYSARTPLLSSAQTVSFYLFGCYFRASRWFDVCRFREGPRGSARL